MRVFVYVLVVVVNQIQSKKCTRPSRFIIGYSLNDGSKYKKSLDATM